jgi:hypothetical protein
VAGVLGHFPTAAVFTLNPKEQKEVFKLSQGTRNSIGEGVTLGYKYRLRYLRPLIRHSGHLPSLRPQHGLDFGGHLVELGAAISTSGESQRGALTDIFPVV